MSKRDTNIFDTPLPTTAAQRQAARHRQNMRRHIDQYDLPPAFDRYVFNSCTTKASADRVVAQFRQGCHLSGLQFSDRWVRGTEPQPVSAVIRKDGTMVCYAIWVLSQQGLIADQMLIASAAAITRHANRPTPSPQTPQNTQEVPNGRPIAHVGDAGVDIGYDGDTGGPDDTAIAGAGILTWDDARQAVVRTPS